MLLTSYAKHHSISTHLSGSVKFIHRFYFTMGLSRTLIGMFPLLDSVLALPADLGDEAPLVKRDTITWAALGGLLFSDF